MAKRATSRRKRARRAEPGTPAVPPVGGWCVGCRWWDARRKTLTYELPTGVGLCRAGGPSPGAEPSWAVTAADEWCGAYERRDEWDETRKGEYVI